MKYVWEKVPKWECLFVNREKGLFVSVYVDDVKLAGKKQTVNPTWEILMKDVDLGEPTPCLFGLHSKRMPDKQGCLDNYRSMFESRISACAVEKLPSSGKLDANISSWSCDMEGHAKK